MNKTTMVLSPSRLEEEHKKYRAYKKPCKYKDNKAAVLIALKPPKFTKCMCYARIPVERTYNWGDTGETRTYTTYDKDDCPYRHDSDDNNQGYGRGYMCGLFGGNVGYRGYRLDICKFVFGKSKNMIKSWRPLKDLATFIVNMRIRQAEKYLLKLYTDGSVKKREYNKKLKAIRKGETDVVQVPHWW